MAVQLSTLKPTPPSQQDNTTYSGFNTIVAWVIVAIIVTLAAKTKIGYTVLFFFVLASILIVLAVGSPTIVKIFSSAQKPGTGA